MNKNSLLLIIPFLLPLEINAALPIYPAEIIGRDLSVYGAGKLGHVGITSAPYIYQDAIHVHEVVNLNPVVQLNLISAFKNESPYWGSRYGISDRGDNAFLILREAYFQNYLACSTYTITANYNPSTGYYDGTGKARASYCGFYRCDTFVNYLFHVGNYTLSTYSPPGEINTPTFPFTVFYLFPKGNGDGPKAQAIQETPFISNKFSINDANLKTLSELSQEEFITVVDISEKKITKDGINNILKLSKDCKRQTKDLLV